jgi:hypothetical protein
MPATRSHKQGEGNPNVCPQSRGRQADNKPLTRHVTANRTLTCPPTAELGLQEAIDTTTPGGKLVFHVFAALAEFERDLIRERTAAGLKAARAHGRHGGRPSVLRLRPLVLGNQSDA